MESTSRTKPTRLDMFFFEISMETKSFMPAMPVTSGAVGSAGILSRTIVPGSCGRLVLRTWIGMFFSRSGKTASS